jgi:hypothetical protein
LRSAGQLTVEFSLIGDNNGSGLAAPPAGSPDANGNLIGTHAAPINPRLAPLANNGGMTQTHAPCAGASAPHASCSIASPALHHGSNALIPSDTFDLDGDGNTAEPIAFDQRGTPFNRIVNTTVDMGALESQPMFPWHNSARPLDVNGGPNNQPNGRVTAGDALAIINYLNAFGAGPVPANATFGAPFIDTTGGPNGTGNNFITPNDALAVINHINAFGFDTPGPSGEGEAPRATGPDQSASLSSDLISLLAFDIAEQAVHRRRPR